MTDQMIKFTKIMDEFDVVFEQYKCCEKLSDFYYKHEKYEKSLWTDLIAERLLDEMSHYNKLGIDCLFDK